MQFPIRAPIRQLHQLIEREVLEIHKQDAEIGVAGDGCERLGGGEARLADVGAAVVRVEAGAVAAMEGDDGEVVVREHGSVDAAGRHSRWDRDGGDEEEVEAEDGGELGDFHPLAGRVEGVPRVDVESVAPQVEGAAQGEREAEGEVFGDEPGGGQGPEVGEDAGALGEVVLDADAFARGRDGVVGPGREAGPPHGAEDDGRRAVAGAELARLPGQEEVADHAEVPLRHGHVQVADEAPEAGAAGDAVPGLQHRALAAGLGGRFVAAAFHRVAPLEVLADLADGDLAEPVGSRGAESIDDSDFLNQAVQTGAVGLGVFVRVGRRDGSDSPVRDDDDG